MAEDSKRMEHEREMRVMLREWERSGLPVARFADQVGMAAKTLYRWRQRLRDSDERGRRGRPLTESIEQGPVAGSPAAMFTEVGSTLRSELSGGATFEIVLHGGTMVRVPAHFDAEALRRLLAVLGEC